MISKLNKASNIYQDAISKYGRCDTIAFSNLIGVKGALFIQNMFPITISYLDSQYMLKGTQIQVCINNALLKEIQKKSKKLLHLYAKGKKSIYPNIDMIRNELLSD